MDGHHFHQLLITLQAQDLLFTSLAGTGQVLGQVADQRLFAVQFAGGLLQQLGQVQQVGQHALAITAGDERARQLEVV
ncbi:hypothetical protein D3C75_852820 [compost metagenome]